MNKSDLIAAVQTLGDYTSQSQATLAVDNTLIALADAIASSDKVSLAGFGIFNVKTRAARTGRNPRTGEVLEIAGSRNVSFKASKNLKSRL